MYIVVHSINKIIVESIVVMYTAIKLITHICPHSDETKYLHSVDVEKVYLYVVWNEIKILMKQTCILLHVFT